jgi:hypothetical protein
MTAILPPVRVFRHVVTFPSPQVLLGTFAAITLFGSRCSLRGGIPTFNARCRIALIAYSRRLVRDAPNYRPSQVRC